MRYASMAGLVVLLVLLWAVPPRAAEPAAPREDLAQKVEQAINRAVKFLRDTEKGRGHWERAVDFNVIVPDGMSALATLALLYAGVSPQDEMLQRSLKHLRDREPEAGGRTYVVSLQTMVYALANQPEDKERLQRCVNWLLEARIQRRGDKKNDLLGWTYHKPQGQGTVADNSNTQYAVLALHEAFQAGATVEPEVWEQIRDLYLGTMIRDGGGAEPAGGWSYRPGQTTGITLTMTTAGVCNLMIADMNLKASKLQGVPKCDGPDCGPDPQGAAKDVLTTERAIEMGLRYIGRHLSGRAHEVPAMGTRAGASPLTFYYLLYGIERTGRFSGQRFLGEKDWYRVICESLTGTKPSGGPVQNADGSFTGSANGPEGVPEIGTSFALLFLAKGRTPVLISKLVHDPEDDWNRHKSDARNLTNYCSKELFKNVPLAWQVFDARRAGGDLTGQRLEELTAELLQSPIAYVSGKKAPVFRPGEENLLRSYLENGGFLMAEACCGSQEFHDGFKSLIEERIFNKPGDPKLTKLPASHPVYFASGKFRVDPSKYPLYGVEMGCKTIVIYSPQGLSCWWEYNYARDGKGREAFELGANIIAYATGLEPPRPRLTQMDVVKDEKERKIPRGFLKVAQIKHEGDSKPAPQAMPNLMLEMRKLGVDVALQTEELWPTSESLTDFRFLYMHGRRDFEMKKEELDQLRFHLETGGVLFADACCGSKQFDIGFRKMIKALWKDKELERIPLKDELFSKELNGEAITEVKCRREGADGKPGSSEFRVVEPQLEGIKINGRWAVIYSRYDIGCALEKHQSTDCLGHDHASAVLLGKAAVLYAMRR
jgi:hypothetical protein